MHKQLTSLKRVLGLAALTLVFPALSQSQNDYPSKPITMVIPFPPAGSTDVLGRLLALEFPKECPELILCHPKHGVTEKEIGSLKAWLKS